MARNPNLSKLTAAAPPIKDQWRRLAEARCAESGKRLTPARLEAYAVMMDSDRPLSAYELIALLEKRQDRKKKA